jgi:hypothetical protein
MDSKKLQEIQSLFNSLINSLHECWYLNEQYTASYSKEFRKLLSSYRKVSNDDNCDMVLNENYFTAHWDSSKATRANVLTNKLHLLLCKLVEKNVFGQSFWTSFVFSYDLNTQEETAKKYNRYMELYSELSTPPQASPS